MIVKLFFLIISSFFVVLFCIKYTKNCTFGEAFKIMGGKIIEFISQVCSASEPAPNYPVFIGCDENGVNPRLVDDGFKTVRSDFDVCFCDYFRDFTNYIFYRFKISGSEEIQNDYQRLLLIQKQAEQCLALHFRNFNFCIPTEHLVAVDVKNDFLGIFFAKNPDGVSEIKNFKLQQRERLLAQPLSHHQPSLFSTSWGKNIAPKNQMVWGYQSEPYREYGVSIPHTIDPATHCHALITGASGSGKSTALLYLIGSRIQAEPDTVLFICDFKNSEDFRFLTGYQNYFAGDAVFDGIMNYYKKFNKARQERIPHKRHLLVVDEYPAFINYLQTQDKINKTKKASEILGAISELLMLGRGTGSGFGVWIITQRPDSALFSNGARDNFMIFCALGNLSKEQRGMIFTGQDIPDRIFQKGEGLLLADGKSIQEVKFPLIARPDEWKDRIKRALMRSGGACADDDA